MANEANETPVYAYTVADEPGCASVFLAFANQTVAEFLNHARTTVARQDKDILNQKEEIGRQTVEIQAKDETITARDREIRALHKAITDKNAKVDELTEAQGVASEALAAAEAKATGLAGQVKTLSEKLALVKMARPSIAKGIERLENGGIRLAVTLDVDEATPLLSWADSAGEDPATYIAKQVKDALVAVTSS